MIRTQYRFYGSTLSIKNLPSDPSFDKDWWELLDGDKVIATKFGDMSVGINFSGMGPCSIDAVRSRSGYAYKKFPRIDLSKDHSLVVSW